jgi:thiamine transport system permease protein
MATAPQITVTTILRLLAIVLIVTVSLVAVIAPLLTVLWRGAVWPDDTTRTYLLTVVRATLWQATLSTLLIIAIAVPTAWAIVRSPGVLASLLTVVIGVPFVMPAPVVATMFALVCGRDSWCASALGLTVPQGLALVVLVHAWYNTGVLVRVLLEAWYAIQGRYSAAASALGASPWRYMMTVEWPLLRPACIAGTTLVFLYCVGSFGVVLLLGGGRVPSLEVETWRQTSQLLRLDVAAGLSVVQLLMSGGLLLFANRFHPLRQLDELPVSQAPAQPVVVRVLAVVWQGVALLFVAVPFVAVIWRLRDVSDWSAIWHLLNQPVRGSGLFVSPVAATLRSVFIASTVALLTLVLAWIASQLHPALRFVTMLPLGISAVTLGLGYIVLFGRWGVLTAWWLVILAHVVIALPLVMRQITLARQQLARHYAWAAATLGASPLRQWYSIEMPLLRRALVAAGLFGFAVSLGDFAASLLLTRPDAVTAPVYIARLLGKPGVQNFQLAQLLSLILACCCVLVIIGAEILLRVRHQSTQKR